MNAEELKKAREICEAATEGPWAIVNYAGFAIYKNPKINIGLSADEQICTFSEDDYYEEMEQPNNTIDNAEFIIFARTALPVALDEIERLQKENAIMSEALEKLSRLGAGDRLGNSDGNCIAQRALKEAKGDK